MASVWDEFHQSVEKALKLVPDADAELSRLNQERQSLIERISAIPADGRAHVRARNNLKRRMDSIDYQIQRLRAGMQHTSPTPYVHAAEHLAVAEQVRAKWNTAATATDTDTAMTQSSSPTCTYADVIRRIMENYQRRVSQCAVPKVVLRESTQCDTCCVELLLSEFGSDLVCPKCAQTFNNVDATSSAQEYGDKIERSAFVYHTETHLNEYITHLQAKETRGVPPDVLDNIMQYLFANGHRSPETVHVEDVNKALKALKYRKYYKRSMQIWSTVTGFNALQLSPVHEEMFRLMFKACFELWPKYKPQGRRNFLSYKYAMARFAMLLGLDDLVSYLKILNGPSKVEFHNEIFTQFCKELDWPDFPVPLNGKYVRPVPPSPMLPPSSSSPPLLAPSSPLPSSSSSSLPPPSHDEDDSDKKKTQSRRRPRSRPPHKCDAIRPTTKKAATDNTANAGGGLWELLSQSQQDRTANGSS